jgi:DUF1680 family protein
MYAVNNEDLYVNLYASNTSEITLNDHTFKIAQHTNYPWSGEVVLDIENEQPINANLMIRVPGWAMDTPLPSDLYSFKEKPSQKTTLRVNGKTFPFILQNGYAVVPGEWKKGDKIEIRFPMEIKTIISNEKVKADVGKAAIQRGPIVYCAEAVDNGSDVLDLHVDENVPMEAAFKKELLHGVTVLTGKGWVNSGNTKKEQSVQLIPYCVWNHRTISEMTVWLPDEQP